jgi:hypothetical protein
MIKDFTPARTSLSSGVIVKQHILERNRVRPAQVTSSNELLEGLVKPFSRGYDTGSGDTGQYEYISGSSIYRFSGGTGGTFEQFNGTEFYPTTVDNIYNVTQSWDESFSTTLGTVIYDRDDQREFYNGEFSGSAPYVKLQRGLGNGDDPCATTLKINPNNFYVYDLAFYSGSDDNFIITSESIYLCDFNGLTIICDGTTTTTTTSTSTTTTSTSTTTTTTAAPVHTFTSIPYGAVGNVFIAGTTTSSIFLTGSPFTMSTIFPPSTTSTLNFINGSTTTGNTISFTLSNTSNATAVSNLQIKDNLGTTYTGVVSGGSGTNIVITFTLGVPTNKTFGFQGGILNLQFP